MTSKGAKPANRSVTQEIGDGWQVTMEWAESVEDGGPARLTIEPIGKMPVGGLSSTVLRQINFREAVEAFRQTAAKSSLPENVFKTQFERDQLRSLLQSDGVSDAYLALLSQHYVRGVDRGQPKINDYLASFVDRPISTVRGHLWQARKKGLLSGSPGRKGGGLSPEAEALTAPFAKEWKRWWTDVTRKIDKGELSAVSAR